MGQLEARTLFKFKARNLTEYNVNHRHDDN